MICSLCNDTACITPLTDSDLDDLETATAERWAEGHPDDCDCHLCFPCD